MTIPERALRLEIKPDTAKQRLFQANLQPAASGAFYDVNDLERIRAANPKGFQPGSQCVVKKDGR